MNKKCNSYDDVNSFRDESVILAEIEMLKKELSIVNRKKSLQSAQSSPRLWPASPHLSSQIANYEVEYKQLFVVTTKLCWKDDKLLRHGGVSGALLGVSGTLLKSNQPGYFPNIKNMTWVGWNGMEVNEEKQVSIMKDLANRTPKSIPVFMTKEIAEKYLDGFSNGILWPLFHYELPSLEIIRKAQPDYLAYKAANQRFADTLLENMNNPGDDILWIHDYQLMLLPRMLTRTKKKKEIFSH